MLGVRYRFLAVKFVGPRGHDARGSTARRDLTGALTVAGQAGESGRISMLPTHVLTINQLARFREHARGVTTAGAIECSRGVKFQLNGARYARVK